MAICLAPNVRSLPYVNSWFAHPFLISPLTFGLYTQHAHLPMLDSYLADPEQHRVAVSTPALRGGPFIDFDGKSSCVAQFREQTLDKCAQQLKGAEAINKVFKTLQMQAKGAGLSAIYAEFDEMVRYFLEISYDVSKQPSVRFFESLFYESSLFDQSMQSCVLERATEKPRSFVLTTPRINLAEDSVEIRAPFDDPLWNRLYGGTPNATDILDAVAPHLSDLSRDIPLLRSMLVPQAVSCPSGELPQRGVRVRYFGHACVLIQNMDTSILIDPMLSYPGETALDHFTYADLPERIDYVLLTHGHQDHVVIETLLRLRQRVDRVIVGRSGGGELQDISLKLVLNHCGFERVTELSEYESIEFPGGRILAAPFYGEHADLDIRAKLVYGVELDGRSSLFFSDSNPPAPEFYEPLRKMMPRIDCLFLGMECVGAPASWLYGPVLQKLLTRGEDQSRRLDGCNSSAALGLWDYFRPDRIFVYAMGAEPWITHITNIVYSEELVQFKEARILEAAIRARGSHAEVLFCKLQLDL